MIESAIQITFSPTAGASRIATPASTRSTIAAGVLSCVSSIHPDLTIADNKVLHVRAKPCYLASPYTNLQSGHLLAQ